MNFVRVGDGTFSGGEGDGGTSEDGSRKRNFRKAQKPARVVDLTQEVVDKLKSFFGYGQEQPVPNRLKYPREAEAHTKAIADLIRDDRERYYDDGFKKFAEKCGYKLCRKAVPIVQDGDFAGIQMKDRNFGLGIRAVFSEVPFGGHAFYVRGFERFTKASRNLKPWDILLDAFLVEGTTPIPRPAPLHWTEPILDINERNTAVAERERQINILVEQAEEARKEYGVKYASIIFDVASPDSELGSATSLRTFSNFGEGQLECKSSF